MPKTSSNPITKTDLSISTIKKSTGNISQAPKRKGIRKRLFKGLTKKESGFVKDYAKSGNGTQAALNNYDINSPNKINVAKSIASELLTKPDIQQAVKSLADMIPDELLAKRHIELLNKREYRTIEGESEDIGPETQAVSKGVELGYKLKGSFAPEKSVSLNITHSTENRDKMTTLGKEIAKQLLNEEIE